MRLGTRLDPRAEEGGRGISSGGGDKLVGRRDNTLYRYFKSIDIDIDIFRFM